MNRDALRTSTYYTQEYCFINLSMRSSLSCFPFIVLIWRNYVDVLWIKPLIYMLFYFYYNFHFVRL